MPVTICAIGGKNNFLAQSIIEELKRDGRKVDVIDNEIITFSNGEYVPILHSSVRRKEVYLIASCSEAPDTEVVQALHYLDALKLAGSGAVNFVQPYFYGGRQDRKGDKRQPITAALYARMYVNAGIAKFITVHLHNPSIEGFFMGLPVENPGVKKILWNQLGNYYTNVLGKTFVASEWSIVFADEGISKECRKFARKVGAGCSGFSKFRIEDNEIEEMDFIGKVAGKKCFLFDDMFDTAGTVCRAGKVLVEKGAEVVFAGATHPVLSGNATANMESSEIKRFFTVGSLVVPESRRIEKLEIYPLGSYFASIIGTDWDGGSIREEVW